MSEFHAMSPNQLSRKKQLHVQRLLLSERHVFSSSAKHTDQLQVLWYESCPTHSLATHWKEAAAPYNQMIFFFGKTTEFWEDYRHPVQMQSQEREL